MKMVTCTGVTLVAILVTGCTQSPPAALDRAPLTTSPASPATGMGEWSPLAPAPLAPRVGSSAVWTGKEVLIWGGRNHSRSFADGARYDPSRDRWTLMSTSPLRSRAGAEPVWTGAEMIVWGGARHGFEVFKDGAAYNPATDSWRVISEGPRGRFGHTAIWTGTRMIIWGGSPREGLRPLKNGWSYDPGKDVWEPIASGNVRGRQGHAATWTGKLMIVHGGANYRIPGDGAYLADGARYDPAKDAWRPLPRAPRPRIGHSAIWMDGSLLLIGGLSGGSNAQRTIDRWTAGRGWTAEELPSLVGGNGIAALTMDETRLFVWGGAFDSAARDPSPHGALLTLGRWRTVADGPLTARGGVVAFWTGHAVIIWGGAANQRRMFNDGARFELQTLAGGRGHPSRT